MAILHKIISVGGESAGFQLPIFRNYKGANQELIQRIDGHDHVASLDPILVGGSNCDCAIPDLEVHIGGEALWAFRDQLGNIHIGNVAEIQAIGRQLLTSGDLDQLPMAAADMAAFCKLENDFPMVLIAAFEALQKLSKRSAEIWRDAVVLLPLIKQDLERQLGKSIRQHGNIDSVQAITRDGMTHIYAPANIALRASQLPRWRAIADIFGIREFKFHSRVARSAKITEKTPSWSLFGIGGISRFVIARPPFSASWETHVPPDGAIAHGPPEAGSHGRQLIIAVVPSDIDHANSINQFLGHLSSDGAAKHAINIRPIGFGTPRKNKPSPAAIRDVLSDFDCIWIIANHRQRQTGNYANSLSAENTASRFVRAASIGLTACLATPDGKALLEEAGRNRGFGLVGGAKYNSSLNMHDMICQVLYSMLCEDAYLQSASRIILLWPYDGIAKREQVTLGGRHYDVELIARPKVAAPIGIVGFALNVHLSKRTEQDFRDFCSSLVAGYGWNVRHDDGQSLLLENEGEAMRIWPVKSLSGIRDLIQRTGEFGRGGDLIVTNQTIPAGMRAFADNQEWGLAHYSELGRFMRNEYRMGVFKDL